MMILQYAPYTFGALATCLLYFVVLPVYHYYRDVKGAWRG